VSHKGNMKGVNTIDGISFVYPDVSPAMMISQEMVPSLEQIVIADDKLINTNRVLTQISNFLYILFL